MLYAARYEVLRSAFLVDSSSAFFLTRDYAGPFPKYARDFGL
jgi:hypothetical protein